MIRLRRPPTDEQVAHLQERFGDLVLRGSITTTPPLPDEVADSDRLELPRIRLAFDKRRHGMLRALIDALNDLFAA